MRVGRVVALDLLHELGGMRLGPSLTMSPSREDSPSTVLPPRSPKTPVNNLDTFFACLLPAFVCVSPT